MNETGMVFDIQRCCAVACAAGMLLVLAACAGETPPAQTQTETMAISQTETTTEVTIELTTAPPPVYNFAPIPDKEPPGQSHEPLRQSEMAIPRASVNDIVKRFGPYESYSTAWQEGFSDASFVELRYPNLTVEIAYDQEPSFSGEEGNTWNSNTEYQLTKADKAVVGRLRRLFWTDPSLDIPAPRGLKIGDTEEDVLRSYLDLRTKYSDTDTGNPWRARIIYEGNDSTPKPYAEFNSSGFYSADDDDCDYSIHYACSDMSYMLEGTAFYIKNHEVIAIGQHCAEGD